MITLPHFTGKAFCLYKITSYLSIISYLLITISCQLHPLIPKLSPLSVRAVLRHDGSGGSCIGAGGSPTKNLLEMFSTAEFILATTASFLSTILLFVFLQNHTVQTLPVAGFRANNPSAHFLTAVAIDQNLFLKCISSLWLDISSPKR